MNKIYPRTNFIKVGQLCEDRRQTDRHNFENHFFRHQFFNHHVTRNIHLTT